VVWTLWAHNRTDIVTARLDAPVTGAKGCRFRRQPSIPPWVSDDGHLVSWRSADVGSLGWRTYRVMPSDESGGWKPLRGNEIGNDHHRLRVDPARGGGVVSLVDLSDDVELIAAGGVGNDLAVYEEYPAHPQAGEGPWHLPAQGEVECSSATAADSVQAYRSPLGERHRHTRPHPRHPALHPDPDACGTASTGWTQHHDRRVHRSRPAGPAALAVPGARRATGQRGR